MRLGNVMDGRGTFPLAFHLIAMYYVQWWLQKCSEEIKETGNQTQPTFASLEKFASDKSSLRTAENAHRFLGALVEVQYETSID